MRSALVTSMVAGLVAVVPLLLAGSAATSLAQTSLRGARLAGAISDETGGTTWAAVGGLPTSPSTFASLVSISCPAAQVCVAVGDTNAGAAAVLETTNGGASWSEPSVSSTYPLLGVSCSSASDCVAVGGAGVNGTIFYQSSLAGPFAAETVPTGVGRITAVSCPSGSTTCLAIAYDTSDEDTDDVITGTSGGSSWSAPAMITNSSETSQNWTSIDCLAGGDCVLGGEGYASGSYAGLIAWTSDDFSIYNSGLYGTGGPTSEVSCASASSCLAEVSGQIYSGSATGGTWVDETTSPPYVDYSSEPTDGNSAIFCVISGTCGVAGGTWNGVGDGEYYTGDGELWTTTDDGSAWTSESLPANAGDLVAVSCAPGGGLCYALGTLQGGWTGGGHGDYGMQLLVDGDDPLSLPGPPRPAKDVSGGTNGADPGLCTCGTGEPVDPENGDFYTSATDDAVSTYGPPVDFTRTYDALAAQAATAPGPLGYGWTDNWAMSLAVGSPATGDVTVTQADGAQVEYDAPANFAGGVCPASEPANGSYCTAPYVLATLSYSTGTTDYTFVTHPQTTYVFNSTGQLLSMEDALGNTDSLSYNTPTSGSGVCPASPASCETITSASGSSGGRSLVLAFSAAGETGQITEAIASTGVDSTYSYCTTSSPGYGTTCSVGDLISVDAPGSLVTTYTYSAADSSPYNNDLATITSPTAAVLTNTYNSSGQVSTQAADGGTTSFSYTDMNESTGTGSVAVTDPDGEETLDNFVAASLVSEVANPSGSAPSSSLVIRNPQTLLASERADADGNVSSVTNDGDANVLTSTDALGNTSENAYNSGDENWCSVSANAYENGAGVTCPSSDPTSAPTAGTDPYPGRTISIYNSAGQLTAVTDALGNTTTYSYTSGVSGVPNGLMYCSVGAAAYLDGKACPSYGATHVSGTATSAFDAAGDVTNTTDPLGNTTTYSYTSSVSGVPNGLMYCSVDPVDYSKSVTCAAYGSHTDGTVSSSFNASGQVTASTDADGDTTSSTYSDGLLSTVTSPDGTETTYTYNSLDEVTQKVVTFSGSGYSATTTDAYDTAGRLYCEVDPYEYAAAVRCPSLPVTTPTPTSDLYPGSTITTYDGEGRVIQTTNPIGGVTYTAYDPAGNVYCTVAPYEAAQGITCPSSPPTLATPSDDTWPEATITTYDGDNRTVQVTNPLGGITLTTYDADSNVEQTTVESDNPTSGAPNIVTTHTYDADDRVLTSSVGTAGSGPGIATTKVSYDPDGNVYCSVSGNAYAATGTNAYQCPAWQAGWIITPPSPVNLYPPSGTGPTTGQANNVTTSFYNADGEELQSSNPDVETPVSGTNVPDTSISAFDADGRTYCTSDPVNVTTWLGAHSSATYPYNCPSSPPSTAPAAGSDPGYVTTIFDYAGRTTSGTDQIGDTTSYTYDPAGNTLTTTDPRGEVTTNCYYYEDASGQCAHSAPAGGGSADDLYSQTTPDTSTDPSGETTTHTYYPGEAAEATTTPAGTTTDTYDALGDLTAAAYTGTATGYSAATNVTYSFFPDGSRETITDGTGTTTYSYDGFGDVLSQALAPATDSGLTATTISHVFYSTGALESVVYPNYGTYTNPTATYTYDAQGNMASVTDWLTHEVTFSTDLDGNETSQDNDVSTSSPSGTSGTAFYYDYADENTSAVSSDLCVTSADTLTQSFSGSSGSHNADGQLTEYDATNATYCAGYANHERNYSYDEDGRVVFQGAVAQGSSANTFSYDASGDPTEVSEHATSGGTFDNFSQSFDAAGEITAQSPESGSGGSSSTYTNDTLGDQLSAASTTTSYSYDQIGQMTSADTGQLTGSSDSYTGDGLVASTSGWTKTTNIDGTNTLYSISCPTTTFCAAGDNAGDVLTYNGTSWTTHHIDGTNTIEGISCPTTTFCVAVDSDGNASVYTGTTWPTPSSIDGTTGMWSVSCTSSSFCAAIDNSGNVIVYSGTWATPKSVDSHMLDRISCASALVCAAVDSNGRVVTTTNGWSTFTTAKTIDGSIHIGSISCPSTTFCVAVDNGGNAITGNPTTNTWNSPVSIDGSNLIESVSCASTTLCVAVDSPGNAVVYNGTSWAAADKVDTATLRGPSCASVTYCVAVDNKGNVIGYDGAALTQMTWDSSLASLPVVVSDATNDYVYGPAGEPVEQVNVTLSPPASNPVFLTYTPADSSWLATSTTGSELSFAAYDAYGTEAYGTPVSPFGYGGQYLDTASGLYDMRARLFEPQTGGFTTRDPDFAETDQAYAYAGGDPVNGGDPSGDEWCLRLGWGSLHCWGTETPPLPADGTSCESFESLQVNQDSAGVAINQGNCSSGSGPVPNTLINYWNGSWNNTPVTAVQTTTALDLLASTPTYEGECDGIWIACLQYWVYPAPATNGTVTIGATTLAVTTPTDVHTYIPSLQTDDILSNGFAYWIEQLLFHEDHRQTDFEIATNLSDAAEVIDNALELAGATVGGPTNCTAGGTRGLPV
jgi:RHS repeat-associated protein